MKNNLLRKLLTPLILFLILFSAAAQSSVSVTLKGGSSKPYILSDFKSKNAQFRFTIRKTDDSFTFSSPTFFRIRLSEYTTIGEIKPGKLLSALTENTGPQILNYKSKIFTEPSGLSLEPKYMGLSVEKENWALGYSYPALLFVTAGNEKTFLAAAVQEISQTEEEESENSFQVNWSEQALAGLNTLFLTGFYREAKLKDLLIKASSYVRGSYNPGSTLSLDFTSYLKSQWRNIGAELGSTFSDEKTRKMTVLFDSVLEYSVTETLGPEPVYGMTSQYRKIQSTAVLSYRGFEFKSVHTKTNDTDNSESDASVYRIKYTNDLLSVSVETDVQRTEETGVSSVTGNLKIKDMQASFKEKNIRLVLSYTLKADRYSLKFSADQDRVLTVLLKYEQP
ncbi:MAG: hypothetical protein K6F82_01235 [Sphaerochaetaceae bacterium]|nr:hypothetical protein [Sphaerochaetaceae bacterium]